MSRRRSSKQDSLELLLDTICNTFGGVLFIAILVVLLLQQAGTGPATAAPTPVPVTPVELQSLMLRMEVVNDELSRLRENRDSQDSVIQTFVPDAIQQLLKDRRDATLRQEALQAEVDRRLTSNAELVTRVENLVVENAQVQPQLAESRSRQQAAQSKRNAARQSRVQEVRLPVTRISSKQEIGIVLRYERLYVWHKYNSHLIRGGLNTDDFVVVSEKDGALVTHPKPTAGILLDGSQESQEAVRQLLKRFRPEDFHLVVITRPDSYGVFHHLRNRAIELGFEYRLMPMNEKGSVFDRGGQGGNVQ